MLILLLLSFPIKWFSMIAFPYRKSQKIPKKIQNSLPKTSSISAVTVNLQSNKFSHHPFWRKKNLQLKNSNQIDFWVLKKAFSKRKIIKLLNQQEV
jgi:hypothetical protein